MFISKIRHRDKATNNALMAKAVEVCEKRQLPYLIYTTWRDTSLVDFQTAFRISGDEGAALFCASHTKGKSSPKTRLHRGLKESLPLAIKKATQAIQKTVVRFALGFD